MVEFGDDLSITYVMGGLARTFDDPAGMIVAWLDAADRSGMPVDPRLWTEAPLTSSYPESRSARRWVRAGWHVALAYVVGFTVMMLWPGWEPRPMRHDRAQPAAATSLQGDSR